MVRSTLGLVTFVHSTMGPDIFFEKARILRSYVGTSGRCVVLPPFIAYRYLLRIMKLEVHEAYIWRGPRLRAITAGQPG
jgi:hypothetical protein